MTPGLERSPGGGNGSPLRVHAWEIPQTEEPDGLQSREVSRKESDLTKRLRTRTAK